MTLPILLLLSHTEALQDCKCLPGSQCQQFSYTGFSCYVGANSGCDDGGSNFSKKACATTSGHPTTKAQTTMTKAPTTMTKAPTTECDPHWKDHEGDDCSNYGDEKWCTRDGKEGQNWQSTWGTLSQQVTNSKTPLACPQCGCGGGPSIHHEVKEDRSPRPSTGGDKWLQPLSGDPDEDPAPLANPKDELKNVAKQCGSLGPIPKSYGPGDLCLKNGAPATCGDCQKQPQDSRWAYAFLDELNIIRCMHNAPPVQYNRKLECWASKWVTEARKIGWNHSCVGLDDIDAQENLSLGKGQTARQAMKGWYKEITDCFRKPSYRFARGGDCWIAGHGMNLIWKSVTHIGCHSQDGASACHFAVGEGEEKYNGHETGHAGNVLTDDLAEPRPTKIRSQCDNAQWKTVNYRKTYKLRKDMNEADVPANYGYPEDTSRAVVAPNTCALLRIASGSSNPCGSLSD